MGPLGGVACHTVDCGERRRQPQRLYSTIFRPTRVDAVLCVGFRHDDRTMVSFGLSSDNPQAVPAEFSGCAENSTYTPNTSRKIRANDGFPKTRIAFRSCARLSPPDKNRS